MKIMSFNINGLRARPHQLEAVIEKYQPDVLGLQEIKVADEDFPHNLAFRTFGLSLPPRTKGHYGVALLLKQAPIQIEKGFPTDDQVHKNALLWQI